MDGIGYSEGGRIELFRATTAVSRLHDDVVGGQQTPQHTGIWEKFSISATQNNLTTMKKRQRRVDHAVLNAILISFTLTSGMAHGGNAVRSYACLSQDAHADRMMLAVHPDGRFIEAGTMHTPSGDVDSDVLGTVRFRDRHEYVQVLGEIYIGALKERSTGMRIWSYEQTGADTFKLTGIKYVDRITGKETDTSKNKWLCRHEPAGDATAEQSFQQVPRGSFY